MGQSFAHTILLLTFVVLTGIAGCNALTGLEGTKAREDRVATSGRIEGDEYNAGAKVNGKVDRIVVKEGQSVTQGTLLGSIFSDQLKAQLAAAQEEVRISQNRVAQAESSLAQSKADTTARVEQAQANLALSREQLAKARSAHKQSLAQLERTRLDVTSSSLEADQARANLKKTQAALSYNEKELGRHRNLLKEEAIARIKFEAAETQYVAAREENVAAAKQVERAVAGIEASRKNLVVAEASVDMGMATIKEAQASVEAARASVTLAQVGSFEAQVREKEVETAKGMLEKARRALESAQADLEDTRVHAPVNGTVLSKVVQPGEVISAGTPLVTLIDMDALYLRVFLPNHIAGKLRIGNPVKVVPDAFQREEFDAYVYQISDKAEFTPKNVETKDERTKLVFSVKIWLLSNKDRKLKPGMPAEATIDLTRTVSVGQEPVTTGKGD
ncbi:MAG: HlyD family efflux transporter periplasmic adaptor subunit [Candidatus Riflebacteria bacterium]|nr:HlyD family efflux transporter periplasmic adaptor subunit [Candidatus Riflebacteria bacterium]